MEAVEIAYVGRAGKARRLAAMLEQRGADVRYDLPGVPGWDDAGQSSVATTLHVRGLDEAGVRQTVSRFREYYPAARVSIGVPTG